MLISDLFPNVNDETVISTLHKYHIEIPEKFKFSEINIVIGPNGSGKTRFLHAIKDLYSNNDNVDILYGYFPSLSDRKNIPDENTNDLPECTLYEYMNMEEANFSDFFREIEAQNENFILELLEYHSQRQKERGDRTLEIISKSFFALTGKELVSQSRKIYVKTLNNKLEPLSSVMDWFSPGELILFYMAIFLAFQQNRKKDKIIILDEPESHLHSKSLISFIEMLTQTFDFKEIWIATHSLFLVPQFEFENIIYINNGKIQSRTSKIYQDIFSELLGDKDGKTKMFFSSLTEWQYCEFIAECFTNPTVVTTIDSNDEQVQLFIQYFSIYRPINILDCGGGSGRLGLSLEETQIGQHNDINYDIYDKAPSYNGEKFGVYTDFKDINKTYNCVVMMNFLHEVEPRKWRQLFYNIYYLLEENAYLLFVETEILSRGEKPNSIGYLVLDRAELEILFNNLEGLIEVSYKNRQKSCGVLVPRESLLNITYERVIKAIGHLEERMFNEIKKFRDKVEVQTESDKTNISAFSSRHYAFLSQQFINAKLFVESEEEWITKNKKLTEVFSVLYELWTSVGSCITKEILGDFQTALNCFQAQGFVSERLIKECRKKIVLLEEKGANKETISVLLAGLVLFDDSWSMDKLYNDGYEISLPSSIIYLI